MPSVFVDARCLQDPEYQFRGIGVHVASILRHRPKRFQITGLLDPQLPVLPAECAELFDHTGLCLNHPLPREGSIFLNASPMTHDTRFTLRFVDHPNLLSAAVVYDFIPFDREGYLNSISQRAAYFAKLMRLKSSAIFLPISQYSAGRLIQLLAVDEGDVRVTGASVRASLVRAAASSKAPYFLTVGGADRRKNTELAVSAVREVNSRSQRRYELYVVGQYGPDYKQELESAAGGVSNGFLRFVPEVDDRALASLYAGAVATITPSHIEGFSLPVVEAAVCGSPVLASKCDAHRELIDREDALFSPTAADELVDRLTRVVNDRAFRDELLRSQQSLPGRYRADVVGGRFWDFVGDRFEQRFHSTAPAVLRRAKPRVAFLSPFPPDQSGVARYTELTIASARKLFDIDLFTEARRPLQLPAGARDGGTIGIYPLLKNKYDAMLSVLGDSHYHRTTLDLFARVGGPCILHDSRLIHIQHQRLGQEAFLKMASDMLGRTVDASEVSAWLEDREPPSLFAEPVVERAQPLIVHTRVLQSLLRERYGVEARLAPFVPNLSFEASELTEQKRIAARKLLGIPDGVFAVSTFGFVDRTKGSFACVAALDLLRSWKIPAELYYVGKMGGMENPIRKAATDFGVMDHIHFSSDFMDEDTYRNYLLASDAAVQLRTYDFGQASAALADCIGAGLPVVATAPLAEACEAPSYVARIPSRISALLIADRLAEVWERPRAVAEAERSSYCAEHNFDRYAERLAEILNL